MLLAGAAALLPEANAGEAVRVEPAPKLIRADALLKARQRF